MLTRLSMAALAMTFVLPSAAFSQSDSNTPQNVPDQIKQKLAEQGYKDVEIAAGSYIVSAKDKNGNPVMMLIGPTEMTVLTAMPQDDQQAQSPDSKGDQIIQQ